MNKKAVAVLVSTLILTFAFSVAAEQPTKVPRIAYLSAGSASSQASRVEVFKQGLRELGYIEGKTLSLSNDAEGKPDRVPALAAELVGLKLDIIVTGGPAATRSAKEATATIPIVMGFDYDPVGSGLIASLARPGGNITGLSSLVEQPKKFEFIINLKAAKQIGLTIPPNVLVRADRVIK